MPDQTSNPPVSEDAVVQAQLRPLDGLKVYDRNARKHSDSDIDALAGWIETYGFTNPILADEKGIVAGHRRRLALLRIYERGGSVRLPNGVVLPRGMVPVIDVSGWTEDQRRRYILIDNTSAANPSWDFETLKLELTDIQALGSLDDLGFDPKTIGTLFGPIESEEPEAAAEDEPATSEPEEGRIIHCPKCKHEFSVLIEQKRKRTKATKAGSGAMAAAKRKTLPTRKPAKAPAGHRPTALTRGIVKRAVDLDQPDEEIAALLAIDVAELRRCYKPELALPQGRPPHTPTDTTRATVERAALLPKMTHDDIAALIGVSTPTLEKHYPDELRNGANRMHVQVTQSFLENVIGIPRGRPAKFADDGKTIIQHAIPPRPGNVDAQKFYLERLAGLVPQTNVRLPIGEPGEGGGDDHTGGFEIKLVPAKDGRRK